MQDKQQDSSHDFGAVLVFVSAIAFLIALGFILNLAFPPGESSNIADGTGVYETGIGLFNDSIDRGLWVAWVLSPVLLLALFLSLSRRKPIKTSMFTHNLVFTLVCFLGTALLIFAIFFADLPILPHLSTVGHFWGLAFVGTVIGLIYFAEVRLGSLDSESDQVHPANRRNVTKVVLVLISGLFAVTFSSGYIARILLRTGEAYDTYHAPFAWSDLLAPFTGVFPFSTYVPQYNSALGFLVEPWFIAFGASEEALSALMAVFAVLILLSMVYILRCLWSLPSALILATLALIFGLITEPIGGAGGYFQVFPLRYTLPILVVVAYIVALRCKSRLSRMGLGIAIGTSAVNNFEWGFTSSMVIFAAFGLVTWLSQKRFMVTIKALAWVALGMVSAITALLSLTWLRSGLVPNPLGILDFARILGMTDNMVQAPVFGLLHVMLITFLATAAWALFRLVRIEGEAESLGDAVLLVIGLMGLIFAIYPFGRSLPVVNYALFLWWALAVFALLGSTLAKARSFPWKEGRAYRVSYLSVVSPFIVLALVVTFAAGNWVSPFDQFNRLSSAERPNADLLAITDDFFERINSEGEPTLFALHGGRQIAARVRQNDYLPFNSSVSFGITRGQTTALAGAMFDSATQRSIIWAPCCTPGPVLDFVYAAGFVNYAFTPANADGAGPLVSRRLQPMGQLRGRSSSGNWEVELRSVRKTISLQTPESTTTSFVVTSQPASSGEQIAPSELLVSLDGLFVPNSLAVSDEGKVVVGGAQYGFNAQLNSFAWKSAIHGWNASGSLLWSRYFSETGLNTITSVDVNSEGEVIAGGGSWGDPTVGQVAQDHQTLYDSFLLYLNSEGELVEYAYANLGGNDSVLSVHWNSNSEFVFVASVQEEMTSLVWGNSTTELMKQAFDSTQSLGLCRGLQSLVTPLDRQSVDVVARTACSFGSGVYNDTLVLSGQGATD